MAWIGMADMVMSYIVMVKVPQVRDLQLPVCREHVPARLRAASASSGADILQMPHLQAADEPAMPCAYFLNILLKHHYNRVHEHTTSTPSAHHKYVVTTLSDIELSIPH